MIFHFVIFIYDAGFALDGWKWTGERTIGWGGWIIRALDVARLFLVLRMPGIGLGPTDRQIDVSKVSTHSDIVIMHLFWLNRFTHLLLILGQVMSSSRSSYYDGI